MYSPKIREEHVCRLYRLKLKTKKTMVEMVRKAVERYLQQHELTTDRAPEEAG